MSAIHQLIHILEMKITHLEKIRADPVLLTDTFVCVNPSPPLASTDESKQWELDNEDNKSKTKIFPPCTKDILILFKKYLEGTSEYMQPNTYLTQADVYTFEKNIDDEIPEYIKIEYPGTYCITFFFKDDRKHIWGCQIRAGSIETNLIHWQFASYDDSQNFTLSCRVTKNHKFSMYKLLGQFTLPQHFVDMWDRK